jgi:hypothetical protein
LDTVENIYIFDEKSHRFRKVDKSTGVITTAAGTGYGKNGRGNIQATSADLCFPAGIFVDASGNVFIADYNNHRIRKVDRALESSQP